MNTYIMKSHFLPSFLLVAKTYNTALFSVSTLSQPDIDAVFANNYCNQITETGSAE
jgi:hypothetical protein